MTTNHRPAALALIRQVGPRQARAIAEREIERAVLDVTYPFGRIGLYAAVRDILEEAPDAQ